MRFTILLVLCLWTSSASADVEIGLGMSSTIGRFVPALSASYVAEPWAISGSSVGVQTPVYYESAYTLAGYKTWKAGDFWWGPVTAGFGGGLAYSQRGYRTSASGDPSHLTDFNLGPAFRVQWNFLGGSLPIFFNFDAIYGLGLASIELAGQDNVIFSLGCRL